MYLRRLSAEARNLTVLKYPQMTREKISTSIILKVRSVIKHDRCPRYSTPEDMAKSVPAPFSLATCKAANVPFNAYLKKKKKLEIIFFLLPVFKMTATDLFSSQLSQPQVPERARLTLLKGNKTVQKQKKKTCKRC